MNFFLQQQNKNCFKDIHHLLFNNQSIELRSSNKTGNIMKEGEAFFKKNPTGGLSEVCGLINLAISKKQGDQRKHSFL